LFVALLMFAMPLAVAAVEEASAPVKTLADTSTPLPSGGSITVSEDGQTVTIEGFEESDYASVSAILDVESVRARIKTLTISGALGEMGWLIAGVTAETASLEELNIITSRSIPDAFLQEDHWAKAATDLDGTKINFTFDGMKDSANRATSLAAILAKKGVPLESLTLIESPLLLDSDVKIETVNLSGASILQLQSGAATGAGIKTINLTEGSTVWLDVGDLSDVQININSDGTSIIGFSEGMSREEISKFLEANVQGAVSIRIANTPNNTLYYFYNTPKPITHNGIIATVTSSPAGVQPSGTAIESAVRISGTAIVPGTFKVALTSKTATFESFSQGAQTVTVKAGQDVWVTYYFHFTMPEQSVTDLDLTFTFVPAPAPGVKIYDVVKHFGTFTGNGSISCEIDTDKFDASGHLRYWKDENTVGTFPAGLTYTLSGNAEGHTIFTLNESGLKGLANGTYKFRALFGSSRSELITLVVDQEVNNPDPPARNDAESDQPPTGDESSPFLFATLLLIAPAGLATCIFMRRREREHGAV
jgi:hypothetical protein